MPQNAHTEDITMPLLQRAELLKDMIQNAIDRGATTVEEVHKTIAAIPFDIAQKNGLFEEDADKAREATMQSIGYVYDKIREVNQIVGELANDMFAGIEDAKNADDIITGKSSSAKK
jgi:hypothetical protein